MNALMKIDKNYPVLADTEHFERVVGRLAENLEGEKLSPFDLPWIKAPAAGGRAFEVPDGDPAKAIEGIIVYHRLGRTYWAEPYGSGSAAPDCFSENSQIGIGDPGGECPKCYHGQFGSAVDEKGNTTGGQACQQRRQVFMLLPSDNLPTVISVPPTSLKNSKQYIFGLANQGQDYWGVITRVTAHPDTAKGGQKFSRLNFELVGPIESEVAERVMGYRNMVRGTVGG